MNIDQKLSELKDYIPHQGKQSEAVSRQSVGWHIDHSIRVIQSIIKRLGDTSPSDYNPPKFNLMRMAIMGTGYIPRGRAKAPKQVRPQEETFTEEGLLSKWKAAQELVQGMGKLPEKSYFEHPYFGHISRKDAPRFLAIHTNHHLKIIRDIVKGA